MGLCGRILEHYLEGSVYLGLFPFLLIFELSKLLTLMIVLARIPKSEKPSEHGGHRDSNDFFVF